MGKTLKRQHKKAGSGQPQQSQTVAKVLSPSISKPKAGGKGKAHAGGPGLVSQVETAFNQSRFDDALALLEAVRRSGEVPKLGAVQRWVRLADLVGEEVQVARLLAAIIRCVPGSSGPMGARPEGAKQGKKGKSKKKHPIRRYPDFQPPLTPCQRTWLAAAPAPTAPATAAAAGAEGAPAPAPAGDPDALYAGAFTLVPQDGATQPIKRPPNWQELKIWRARPGVIRFGPDPRVQRVDVPFVGGAFVLCGVLSPDECRQLVAATEWLGYAWDVDYNFNPSNPASAAAAAPGTDTAASSDAPAPDEGDKAGAGGQHPVLSAARVIAGGDRAAGCVWLADDSLMGPIWRRVQALLPQKLCGGTLGGVNVRWRFYRYDQGNVYRPHVDGAWPGSGLSADGKLVHDAFGDRWSRLTFLVYLNDDFEGGQTTFFTPALDDPAALDAHGVRPCAGNILCFPHGDTTGALVHEGSAVTKGAKYVIRTEVLYTSAGPPNRQPAAPLAQQPPAPEPAPAQAGAGTAAAQ